MTERDCDGLSEWLQGEGGDEFVREMADRRPKLFALGGEERLTALRASVEIDTLIASLPVPANGWLSLVDGRSRDLPRRFLTDEGLVDLTEVTRAYADGSTLLLTKLHRRVPAVGELCRGVEARLLADQFVPKERVGANLYLTPAGTRGFDLHYDDHDVLVVQLAGEKHWQVYEEWVDSPVTPPTEALSADEVGEPLIEQRLRCGDLLYIPSGFPHQARAVDEVGSSHITLSIRHATWLDLARSVLVAHPPARRVLRGQDLGTLTGEALTVLADGERLEAAVELLRHRFVEGLHALPDGVLGARHPAAPLALHSTVQVRRGVLSRLTAEGADAVVLTVPGAVLRVSAAARPALEHILEKGRAVVDDLPGELGANDKLYLVRALILHGVVKQAESA